MQVSNEVKSPLSECSQPPPCCSFAALDAPDTRAADVAPLFGAVLQEGSGADAGDKARALAGLAMCALVDDPPSLDTAKQLVANAKEVRGHSRAP